MGKEELEGVFFHYIKCSTLSSIDPDTAMDWLANNRDCFLSFNTQRISLLNQCADPTIPDDPRILRYCSEDVSKMIASRTRRACLACRPVLLANIYTATRYPIVTCHYLFFGRKEKVELMSQEKFFLKKFNLLSEKDANEILDFLRANQLECNNPAYILRNRLRQLSNAHGINDSWFIFKLMSTRYSAIIKKGVYDFMKDESILPIIDKPEDCEWNYNSTFFVVLMVICAALNLTVDFFLLPDYSHLAQIDGVSLSKNDREVLSDYLWATPEAQRAALTKIMFELLEDG